MVVTENNITNFVQFLRNFVPITDLEVKKLLLPVVKERNFAKKQLITQAGEVEQYMNFIESGLIRKYYKQDSEEHIVQLAREGHLITSEASFYTRTPSEYYVETIEPSTILSIAHDDLENLFTASHNFERMGRLITMHTMVLKDKWQISLIMQSPRERFVNFVENYPEIIQRVQQKYLASYLNIKPETFSRFKHLIRDRGRHAGAATD
ncbi:Crp/Fnr family transcriptional regulator [Niabella terrae]